MSREKILPRPKLTFGVFIALGVSVWGASRYHEDQVALANRTPLRPSSFASGMNGNSLNGARILAADELGKLCVVIDRQNRAAYFTNPDFNWIECGERLGSFRLGLEAASRTGRGE